MHYDQPSAGHILNPRTGTVPPASMLLGLQHGLQGQRAGIGDSHSYSQASFAARMAPESTQCLVSSTMQHRQVCPQTLEGCGLRRLASLALHDGLQRQRPVVLSAVVALVRLPLQQRGRQDARCAGPVARRGRHQPPQHLLEAGREAGHQHQLPLPQLMVQAAACMRSCRHTMAAGPPEGC